MTEEITLANLNLEDQIFSIAFHPVFDVIATALITGKIELFSYREEGHESVSKLVHHNSSCRCLLFREDGNCLFSASSDGELATVDLVNNNVVSLFPAHEVPIYCMQFYNEFVCTGDDNGEIKVWDVRSNKPALIFSLDEHTDFVSDILAVPQHNMLLATGGDGALTTWDMRKGNLNIMSEQIEDELLSIVLMKNGEKIVCGSQEGVLEIFSWGNFGDIDDRFPGHPNSIDSMLKIDENVLITGSSDGLIRVVSIQPNHCFGSLGEHEEDMPIERLALSRDKKWVASCSHDQTVRFWNATELFEDEGTFPESENNMEEDAPVKYEDSDESKDSSESEPELEVSKKKKKKSKKPGKGDKDKMKNKFFSGL